MDRVGPGLKIQFQTVRWLRGSDGDKLVEGRGWVVPDDGWNCESNLSFHTTEGDELLVTGYRRGRIVYPN